MGMSERDRGTEVCRRRRKSEGFWDWKDDMCFLGGSDMKMRNCMRCRHIRSFKVYRGRHHYALGISNRC
jgi:hypothetical protein